MKLIQLLTTLTAAIFFTTGAISEGAKSPEWLFVHTAPTAEMTSNTTLVIPVTRDIFAFTDRPNRRYGYLNAHEWVSAWDESESAGFKADPPNAVLTWVDGEDVKDAEVLIINATVGDYGKTIAYEVKLEAGGLLAANLSSCSLFVDGHVLAPRPHWHPDGTFRFSRSMNAE